MDEMKERDSDNNRIIDELKAEINSMTAMRVEVETKAKIQKDLQAKISQLEEENKKLQIQREVDSIEKNKIIQESEIITNDNKRLNQKIKELVDTLVKLRLIRKLSSL